MIVLVVLVVLQAVEAAVVRPVVDARTVRVGPTIPIIVALLGFELYGVGGAIYGIALAVIALAALDAVGRLRGDDPDAVDDRPAPIDAGRPTAPDVRRPAATTAATAAAAARWGCARAPRWPRGSARRRRRAPPGAWLPPATSASR